MKTLTTIEIERAFRDAYQNGYNRKVKRAFWSNKINKACHYINRWQARLNFHIEKHSDI
jgi:ribosome modulation factor